MEVPVRKIGDRVQIMDVPGARTRKIANVLGRIIGASPDGWYTVNSDDGDVIDVQGSWLRGV